MSIITRAYGASKLLLKANAPTIMVVGGVASMGTGAILASIKTLKIEEKIHLEDRVRDLEKIETGRELELEGYSEDIARADRIKVYGRLSFDLVKLYTVPGVFLVGGGALIFGGHRILVQRNATLAIAYTGLSKAFEAYRNRVAESYGEMAESAIHRGGVVVGAREDLGDKIYQVEGADGSGDIYSRVFEQGASESWQNDLGVNKMFLHQQNRFAQELLIRRGYLYLSEVYLALGFPESDISRVVGWKVKKNPDGSKDFPVVDFGLDTPYFDDHKWSGQNAVYLDFNCQGLIVGGKVQKILEQA